MPFLSVYQLYCVLLLKMQDLATWSRLVGLALWLTIDELEHCLQDIIPAMSGEHESVPALRLTLFHAPAMHMLVS